MEHSTTSMFVSINIFLRSSWGKNSIPSILQYTGAWSYMLINIKGF
jgi:hypothetical protein